MNHEQGTRNERLVVVDDGPVYRLQWFVDSDIGATVGEGSVHPTEVPDSDDEGWEYAVETLTAKATPGCRHDGAFYWETRAAAVAARRAVLAALRGKPLADWEEKALAAGWKPPKGRM